MGRVAWSCVGTAAVIGLATVGSFISPSLCAEEPPDVFKVNSVWQGTLEQSNPKSSDPMILFVKQRKGDSFEGVTWYPTIGNGLIKVTGRIDGKGGVTFTEEKVIHGDVTAQGRVVVAGSKYSAKLEGTVLKGTGEWVDPKTKDVYPMKFSLKSAE